MPAFDYSLAHDSDYTADYLDAMADFAYEQEEAMRESNEEDWNKHEEAYAHDEALRKVEQDEWDGVSEISKEELYACDFYNERYVYTLSD